jgi:hypothetical protein
MIGSTRKIYLLTLRFWHGLHTFARPVLIPLDALHGALGAPLPSALHIASVVCRGDDRWHGAPFFVRRSGVMRGCFNPTRADASRRCL